MTHLVPAPLPGQQSAATERRRGRVLGVDLGEVRVGLALSDGDRRVAIPWRTLRRRPGTPVATELAAAVEECGAQAVVVGLPLSLSGGEGPAARATRQEVARLEAALVGRHVTVCTVDERFTTVGAEAALRRGGVPGRARRQAVDQVAAAMLLQAWLDQER